METERKAAAREYVEKFGLSVLLLEPRDKRPSSEHGSKDACCNWERINWAFNQFKNADFNIGIATGSTANNLIVIDCDVDEEADKDGCGWLADWEHENGVKLPKTATVETGRGGSHFYYWNKSGRKIKNSANADIAVDIRGEGGYVMAPPSIHPNGRKVFWDVPPDEVPIAEADEVVFRLIDEVQHGRGVFDDCFVMPDEVGKGERNDTMHKFACSLWAKSTPPDKLWARMQSINKDRFKPPINGRELRTIYNSVTKLPQGYSDEVKEQQAKKAEREKDGAKKSVGRPRKFEHDVVARMLIEEHDACKIGGAPAIRVGGIFKTGWSGIDGAIYDIKSNATTANLREVHNWLDVKAPTREISPWNLIAFQNGVFDLKKHAFREFADDDVFTSVIPHDYNKDAGTRGDAIHKFLVDVSSDDLAIHANLLETLGLCMLHVSRYEYAPVLLGRGSNGKSTFMNFISYVIGEENVALLQPDELGVRFQKASLVGKLVNLSDDIANGYLDGKECAEIKRLATGEPTRTDVKGSNAFNFIPCCTLIFNANTFPRLADTSDGMMRRLFPIEFSRIFKGAEKKPHLSDELQVEECAERAIYDAVEMLQLLIERGEMTPNDVSTRIKQEIVTDNSTVLQWVDDIGGWCEVQGESKETAYSSYETWARNNGVRNPVSAKTMCNEIKAHSGMTLCEFSRDDLGKRTRVFGHEKSKK